MQVQKQHTSVSDGYVQTCRIDETQKNWFEAVNNCFEANHAASMQITVRKLFIWLSSLDCRCQFFFLIINSWEIYLEFVSINMMILSFYRNTSVNAKTCLRAYLTFFARKDRIMLLRVIMANWWCYTVVILSSHQRQTAARAEASGFPLFVKWIIWACFFFLKAKERRGRLPGDLSDKRLQLFGFISPGEWPAHVAGSISHIGTNAARSPLFFVGQRFDNERNNCKQTVEMDEKINKKNQVMKAMTETCYLFVTQSLWCREFKSHYFRYKPKIPGQRPTRDNDYVCRMSSLF